MKNIFLSFAFLFIAVLAFGQNDRSKAQELTDQLTEKFSLTDNQQLKMLAIQERLLEDLTSIEGLKKTDRSAHIKKIRSLKSGTEASMNMMFTEEQRAILRQDKTRFRIHKSDIYKELKSSGATQGHIDFKISEMEEAALLGQEF